MTDRVPMLDVILRPESALDLAPSSWASVLSAARHSSLLPRIALLLDDAGVTSRLPEGVREQFVAARPMALHHERCVRWEVSRIQTALQHLGTRIILLKGAAYVMAGLPAGRGRLASDVDILVPQGDLRAVEQSLLAAGWAPIKLDPYDQRFYRQWSHELPPLRHSRRRTVIDVHHNILPVSGRVRIDANRLLEWAVPVLEPGVASTATGLWMLAPEDMMLHNAAHLFQDGDLGGSVRDLVDADALLRDFGARLPGFWDRLPRRARDLGLERSIFYVLRYARQLLATPVPAAVDASLPAPPAMVLAVMDRLVARALLPVRGRHGSLGEETSRLLLYIRSHWLRMPPGQLAAHLTRKAMRRWTDEDTDTDTKN